MTNEQRKRFQKEREVNRDKLVTISINTHVPSKWRFTDLETGEIWRWEGAGFTRGAGFALERRRKS